MSKISNAVSGFAKGAMIIPALGLAAHFLPYAGDISMGNDYSLQHRFECAYSFKTPDSHKIYHATPIINGYSQDQQEERYLATPWVMWPATLLMGALGAAGAVSEGEEKRRAMYAGMNRVR